jgi:hypothetical protein
MNSCKENLQAEAGNIVRRNYIDGEFNISESNIDIGIVIKWLSSEEYAVFRDAFCKALAEVHGVEENE